MSSTSLFNSCETKVLTEEDFGFLNHAVERKDWGVPTNTTLEDLENQVITATLQRTHGNIKETAGILGIDRSTLYDRIKRHNLPRN